MGINHEFRFSVFGINGTHMFCTARNNPNCASGSRLHWLMMPLTPGSFSPRPALIYHCDWLSSRWNTDWAQKTFVLATCLTQGGKSKNLLEYWKTFGQTAFCRTKYSVLSIYPSHLVNSRHTDIFTALIHSLFLSYKFIQRERERNRCFKKCPSVGGFQPSSPWVRGEIQRTWLRLGTSLAFGEIRTEKYKKIFEDKICLSLHHLKSLSHTWKTSTHCHNCKSCFVSLGGKSSDIKDSLLVSWHNERFGLLKAFEKAIAIWKSGNSAAANI